MVVLLLCLHFLKSGHGYAPFNNECRVNVRVDSKFANNKKSCSKIKKYILISIIVHFILS